MSMADIPEIRMDRGIPTLYVQGEPFIALAGELHNSSASSLSYMDREVWPRLEHLNLNTVLLPLYWECVEPEEGQYDFTLMDGLITQARAHNLHLVFLWFGLWKNGESAYVPGWMKRDCGTYFRVRRADGEPISTISPLCEAAVERDAAAFSAVMAHLRQVDEEQSTVLFIQVENEIGLLGTERDYGDRANTLFEGEIPPALASGLHVSGTWREAFGDDAEESFMAWHFACGVERIASAGRARYPLPCYANCMLRQYPWYPGSYPSGGPVRDMHPIWRIAAPSLFAFAPDIYVPYVAQVLDEYAGADNPLLVPEIRADVICASCCLYAIGQHNAICFSPFGIEDLALPPEEAESSREALRDAGLPTFDLTGSAHHLSRTYEVIREMMPLYLRWRGTPHLRAWLARSQTDCGAFLRFDRWDLSVAYDPRVSGEPLPAGLVYELSENRFLILGMGSTLTFRPKPGETGKPDILRLEEGELQGGQWVPGRILNGDEKMSLRFGHRLSCLMVELFRY